MSHPHWVKPQVAGLEHHVAIGFFGLLVITSLFGNTVLLLSVIKNIKLRDPSTMLLAYLSSVDVLYVIYNAVLTSLPFTDVEITGLTCRIIMYCQYVLRSVPSVIMLLISIERFISACYPSLSYQLRQLPHLTTKTSIIVWLLPLSLNGGMLFIDCVDRRIWYQVFLLVSIFIVPSLVESTLFMVAIHRINVNLGNPHLNKRVMVSSKTILKIFFTIFMFFAVCNISIQIATITDRFTDYEMHNFVRYLLRMCTCLPCLVNPICYYYASSKFRQEIRKLFCTAKVRQERSRMASEINQEWRFIAKEPSHIVSIICMESMFNPIQEYSNPGRVLTETQSEEQILCPTSDASCGDKEANIKRTGSILKSQRRNLKLEKDQNDYSPVKQYVYSWPRRRPPGISEYYRANKLSSLTFRGPESNPKKNETTPVPENKTKGVLRLTKEEPPDSEQTAGDAKSFNNYGKKSSRVTFQDFSIEEETREKRFGKKSKKYQKEKYFPKPSIADDFSNATTETTFL